MKFACILPLCALQERKILRTILYSTSRCLPSDGLESIVKLVIYDKDLSAASAVVLYREYDGMATKVLNIDLLFNGRLLSTGVTVNELSAHLTTIG